MKKSDLTQRINFHCPKCSNSQCDIGEMLVAGGLWATIFKLTNRRFTTVTCARCSYTEIYRAEKSKLRKGL
ncbi:MAG: GTP-binding protein [Deltaproteobacteria bacterium]|nr:GTP-binding protein [Deltaproteobacteria bacterium]